jgi:uncharacterized protein YbjT (DUF2867 family)
VKITVVGGTGLIGTRVVRLLRSQGHDVVAAARATGVNSYTGEGLPEALEGASVVVDVSNSSYVDEAAAREFFYASTLNLLTYGDAAGVGNHVSLSVVGTDRLARAQGGYFIAKQQQERLIATSGRPFSLVHSTQFFEFIRAIADSAVADRSTHLPDVQVRPIAADDVASAIVDATMIAPTGVVNEIAGPEVFGLLELAAMDLRYRQDDREVAPDPLGTYFGARLQRTDLLPGDDVRIMPTRYHEWRAAERVPDWPLAER